MLHVHMQPWLVRFPNFYITLFCLGATSCCVLCEIEQANIHCYAVHTVFLSLTHVELVSLPQPHVQLQLESFQQQQTDTAATTAESAENVTVDNATPAVSMETSASEAPANQDAVPPDNQQVQYNMILDTCMHMYMYF